MRASARLLGHPIHPMLIVLPLGLLPGGVVFDIVWLVTGRAEFADVAFWTMLAGVIGGLTAAVFGLVVVSRLPEVRRVFAVEPASTSS